MLKGLVGQSSHGRRSPKADHPLTHLVTRPGGMGASVAAPTHTRPSIVPSGWGRLGEGPPNRVHMRSEPHLNPYPPPGPSRRSRPSRRSTPGPAEAAPRGPWYRFLAPRDGLSVFYSGQPKNGICPISPQSFKAAACKAHPTGSQIWPCRLLELHAQASGSLPAT